MKRSSIGAAGLLAAAWLVASTGTAHAYLDPGSASLILQSVIGAISAGVIAIGVYWQKLKGFFMRKDPSRQDGSLAMDEHADREPS